MKREDILNLLNELLELPPGALTGPERLADIENWNSLAVISWMALADDRCGVALSPKQLVKCRIVDDLVSLIAT